MSKLIVLLFPITLLVGCSAHGERTENAEEIGSQDSEIAQPEQSDPIADAGAAMAKDDFRLLAFANRVINFPGVDVQGDELEALKRLCGYRILPGTGDQLRPHEDMSLRRALRDYATQYNQQILQACKAYHNRK